MLTDDLRKDLYEILAGSGDSTVLQARDWIVAAVEDWLYDNGFIRVYSKDEAQLEYLNYLDEFYPPVKIDGLEIKASDIMRNLPGNQFNLAVTQFIAEARQGIIK